jgi:superfamily I DNA/RNA helicase
VAGGVLTFRVSDGTGAAAGEREIAITGALAAPGATWNDLVAALNAGGGAGVSPYATASFDAAEGRIKLMTGHRSKGLEYDRVFFLDQFLLKKEGQDPNVRYVIQTRARESLFYVESAGWIGE